jgi:hypothetical protein
MPHLKMRQIFFPAAGKTLTNDEIEKEGGANAFQDLFVAAAVKLQPANLWQRSNFL